MPDPQKAPRSLKAYWTDLLASIHELDKTYPPESIQDADYQHIRKVLLALCRHGAEIEETGLLHLKSKGEEIERLTKTLRVEGQETIGKHNRGAYPLLRGTPGRPSDPAAIEIAKLYYQALQSFSNPDEIMPTVTLISKTIGPYRSASAYNAMMLQEQIDRQETYRKAIAGVSLVVKSAEIYTAYQAAFAHYQTTYQLPAGAADKVFELSYSEQDSRDEGYFSVGLTAEQFESYRHEIKKQKRMSQVFSLLSAHLQTRFEVGRSIKETNYASHVFLRWRHLYKYLQRYTVLKDRKNFIELVRKDDVPMCVRKPAITLSRVTHVLKAFTEELMVNYARSLQQLRNDPKGSVNQELDTISTLIQMSLSCISMFVSDSDLLMSEDGTSAYLMLRQAPPVLRVVDSEKARDDALTVSEQLEKESLWHQECLGVGARLECVALRLEKSIESRDNYLNKMMAIQNAVNSLKDVIQDFVALYDCRFKPYQTLIEALIKEAMTTGLDGSRLTL